MHITSQHIAPIGLGSSWISSEACGGAGTAFAATFAFASAFWIWLLALVFGFCSRHAFHLFPFFFGLGKNGAGDDNGDDGSGFGFHLDIHCGVDLVQFFFGYES